MIRAEVDTWLEEVERAVGKRPVLYVTRDAYDVFLRGRAFARPLWFRDVVGEPRVDAGHAWSIWQFWPRGRVEGIAGPVDLNAARGPGALVSAAAPSASGAPPATGRPSSDDR